MKNANRDLLVLLKDDNTDQQIIGAQLAQLNKLLIRFETENNFCIAHELIDVNRYKIVQEKNRLLKLLQQQELKPFQFLINKN
ncbi:MAG: hypothetical protein SFU21_00475 [Flavihumibacter sp.]|nr:hypothetical protein [Flavihumibacter sp.]